MSDEGSWPRAFKRVCFDFLTHKRAPSNDGIVAPNPEQPAWVARVAALPGSVEVARRARENAESAAKTAEDKASRLVQVSLALLTITLALGSYQLEFALSRNSAWLISLIPIAIALICLALSAFEALQIDRVGMYSIPDGSELATAQTGDVLSIELAAEVRGMELADWTSRYKHSDLMQARAWFTRGLAALVIAGILAGVTRANSAANTQTVTKPPSSVLHHSDNPIFRGCHHDADPRLLPGDGPNPAWINGSRTHCHP